MGSYKTARLLLQKLRRAMVDPDRASLAGVVEADKTSLRQRRGDDPRPVRRGRAKEGRLLVAGAVESPARSS